MLEGTLDPKLRDTQDLQNPFKKGMAMLNKIGFGPNLTRARWEEGDATFTQAQVDEAVGTAVAEAKSGAGTFYDGFAPELKEHPSITRYKSVEELAKGHTELEKRIGLKGVTVPVEGSSDQVKNDFFKAVGRPDAAEGYTDPVLDNLHEGVKSTNEQDAKWFKDLAFKAGLSVKQKEVIHDEYVKLQSQRLTDWDKMQEDERNTAATALRNEWGANYDARLALANGLVKKFGSQELMSEVGNNPGMIKLLANLGSQLSEDKLGEIGSSGLGITPEQAKQEITKITKTIMETDSNDPTYKDMLAKKDMLYKIAYPSGSPTT